MARNTFRTDEALEPESHFRFSHFMRLYKCIKPYKWLFLATFLVTIISGFLGLLAPFLTMRVIDEAIPNEDMDQVFSLVGIMAASLVFNIFMIRFRVYAMAKVGQGIIKDLRHDLFEHMQRLPFSYYDSRPHGKILVRVVNYINSLSDMLSNGLLTILTDMLSLVGIVVMMLIIDAYLTLISLVGLPVLLIATFLLKSRNRKAWRIVSAKQSNMNAYIHESISGVKVTQSFNREAENARLFAQVSGSLKDSWLRAVRVMFLLWPTVENISVLAVAFFYVYTIGMLNYGGLTVGVLVAFVAYISRFWGPIHSLANWHNVLVANMSFLERIFESIDEPVVVKDAPNAVAMPPIRGEVSFKNVDFFYEESKKVLNDVSFTCKQGDTIALVGPTGAGKTTIVNLLYRFYEINSGQILIDGFDISKATLATLRSQMGIMLQDSFVFSDTIMENIRYSRLDATDEEVIAAAKAVCAHDFIMQFEEGYQTELNERGSRLSAGQLQLISFARALLADPKILILDEATANIDTRTEKALQEGLNRLLENRTSFIIAHRLSTIQKADTIMVVNNGKIIEAGSHQQLIEQKRDYYRLFMSQQIAS